MIRGKRNLLPTRRDAAGAGTAPGWSVIAEGPAREGAVFTLSPSAEDGFTATGEPAGDEPAAATSPPAVTEPLAATEPATGSGDTAAADAGHRDLWDSAPPDGATADATAAPADDEPVSWWLDAADDAPDGDDAADDDGFGPGLDDRFGVGGTGAGGGAAGGPGGRR
ncbi:MAG TPA: hypothetical protein VK875_07845 [Euzebyales bacterium]|nr:hypothetical protein [Euzebyales bacterium]